MVDFMDEYRESFFSGLSRYAQREVNELEFIQAAATIVEHVWAAGKHRKTVAARNLLCYWVVRQLGLSMSSLAQRLGIFTHHLQSVNHKGQGAGK